MAHHCYHLANYCRTIDVSSSSFFLSFFLHILTLGNTFSPSIWRRPLRQSVFRKAAFAPLNRQSVLFGGGCTSNTPHWVIITTAVVDLIKVSPRMYAYLFRHCTSLFDCVRLVAIHISVHWKESRQWAIVCDQRTSLTLANTHTHWLFQWLK